MKAFIRLSSLVLMAGVLLSFCGCNKAKADEGISRRRKDTAETEDKDDEEEEEFDTFLEEIESGKAVGSGKNYSIYDEDFNKHIIEARWWDYDNTMEKPGVYSKGTETLAFSVEVDESLKDTEIYYAFFYSKDDDFDKSDFRNTTYEAYITPTDYDHGKYYFDVEYYSSDLKEGYYVVVMASDHSFKKPYAVAYAELK